MLRTTRLSPWNIPGSNLSWVVGHLSTSLQNSTFSLETKFLFPESCRIPPEKSFLDRKMYRGCPVIQFC